MQKSLVRTAAVFSGIDLKETSVNPSELRFLVVDDSPNLADKLRRGIRTRQMEIDLVVVTNGQEALEALIADNQYDLIITDYHMPVMNGLELLKRVKSDERWKRIPVFMVTTSSGVAARAQALGVDGFSGHLLTGADLMYEIEGVLAQRPNT